MFLMKSLSFREIKHSCESVKHLSPLATDLWRWYTWKRNAELLSWLTVWLLFLAVSVTQSFPVRYYTLHYYLADDTAEILENMSRPPLRPQFSQNEVSTVRKEILFAKSQKARNDTMELDIFASGTLAAIHIRHFGEDRLCERILCSFQVSKSCVCFLLSLDTSRGACRSRALSLNLWNIPWDFADANREITRTCE